MTDKERIEIYVNKLPKSCDECPCLDYEQDCRLLDDENLDWAGEHGKHTKCPLKTIQSVQNQKAIEQLEKVKEYIDKDRTELIEYDTSSGSLMADAFLCDVKNFTNNIINELKGKVENESGQ